MRYWLAGLRFEKCWFRSSVGLEQQPSKLWVLGSNPNGITKSLSNLQEIDFGEWEAQPTERLYQQFPNELAQFWQTPLSFTPPQAESLLAFKSRVLESVETLTQQMHKQGWQRALIISHGGVIKLLKCQALKQNDNDLLKMSAELGQLNRFVFDQGQLQFIQSEDV